MECEYCGKKLGEEEEANPRKDRDGDLMCDGCYGDHHCYWCPICGDQVEKNRNEEHIFVPPPLAEDQKIETGIYSVKSNPWYISDMFSMWIIPGSLERVSNLPEGLEDEPVGDYVCEDCANSTT